MDTILQARVGERHIQKMATLKAQTGLTVSQLFRQLIERAEVKPLEATVNLSANANNDVTTREGSHVVVAV
jgi:hypothetical protein